MTSAIASEVRARLAARAFLFDDPDVYMAGVNETLVATRDGTMRGTTMAAPGSPEGEDMANKDKGSKSTKTAATKTPKEKREAKREKKQAKAIVDRSA